MITFASGSGTLEVDKKLWKGQATWKIKEDTFSISDCQPLKVEVYYRYLLETCVSSLLRYFEGKLEVLEDVARRNERKLRTHRRWWPWKEVFCWHNLRMCVRKSLPLNQYLLMNDKKLLSAACNTTLLQLPCKISEYICNLTDLGLLNYFGPTLFLLKD